MRNQTVPYMLIGLAGAIGLLWWSRTRSGGQATSDAFDAAMRAARDAAGNVEQGVITMVDAFMPRGIRNNNPGNIDRHAGTQWKGMSDDQTSDSRFIVFTAPEWGIRAIARIIKTYMGRGATTIEKIISTWAPPNENNTAAYIAAVASEVGIPATMPVGPSDMPAIIAAIIRHENGRQPYPPEVIAKGIELERSA